MDKNVLTNFLNKLENQLNNINCTLYLVEKTPKSQNKFLLHTARLVNTLKNEISSILLNTINSKLNGKDFIEFNPIGSTDDHIEFISANEVSAYDELFNRCMSKCVVDDLKDVKMADLSFYLYELIEPDTNTCIYLIKRYTSPKIFEKRFLLRLLDNAFVKLDENFFSIENDIDLLIFGNEILIFNRYTLETTMSYKDSYYKVLEQALLQIEETDIIDNIDTFKDACLKKISIAKKFTNAVKKGNLSKVVENLDKLPYTIGTFDLDIEIENNKIIFRDDSQLEILAILFSDGFASTLTGSRNVAIEKEQSITTNIQNK